MRNVQQRLVVLQAYFCATWPSLAARDDFTCKHLPCRMMWRLLQDFPGSADQRMRLLSDWAHEWDAPLTTL